MEPWIPKLTEAELKSALTEQYGLQQVDIQTLASYGDQNVYVKTAGEQYVFKIYSSRDTSAISEALFCLLNELAKNNFPAPKIVKNVHGYPYSLVTGIGLGGNCKQKFMQFTSHLQTYLPGQQLSTVKDVDDQLYFKLGRFLGWFHVALKEYRDPFYDAYLSKYWSLTRLPDLSVYIDGLPKTERDLLVQIMQDFKIMKQEKEENLPKGMVHGDPNDTNILVCKKESDGCVLPNFEICGIFDFGETSFACYVYDIATSIKDMCVQNQNWRIIGEMLRGYSSQRPITKEELSVLKLCVCGRLAQCIINGFYSSLMEQDNQHVKNTVSCASSVMKQLYHMSNETFFRCANISASDM